MELAVIACGDTQPTVDVLIFAIHVSLRTQKTLDVAFRKLVWSFNALQEGKWPVKDWNGVAMAYEKALSLCLEDLIS